MATWYEFWSHRTILFQDTFGDGGDNLKDPSQRPGKFRLKPVFGKDFHGNDVLLRFKIKCKRWDANPALNGLILAPIGTNPNTIAPLPRWNPNDQTVIDKYEAALDPFVKVQMDPAPNDAERLEGLYTVASANGINVDLMRVIVFHNAVVDGSSLALVTFKLLQGLANNQDGGGSGPP